VPSIVLEAESALEIVATREEKAEAEEETAIADISAPITEEVLEAAKDGSIADTEALKQSEELAAVGMDKADESYESSLPSEENGQEDSAGLNSTGQTAFEEEEDNTEDQILASSLDTAADSIDPAAALNSDLPEEGQTPERPEPLEQEEVASSAISRMPTLDEEAALGSDSEENPQLGILMPEGSETASVDSVEPLPEDAAPKPASLEQQEADNSTEAQMAPETDVEATQQTIEGGSEAQPDETLVPVAADEPDLSIENREAPEEEGASAVEIAQETAGEDDVAFTTADADSEAESVEAIQTAPAEAESIGSTHLPKEDSKEKPKARLFSKNKDSNRQTKRKAKLRDKSAKITQAESENSSEVDVSNPLSTVSAEDLETMTKEERIVGHLMDSTLSGKGSDVVLEDEGPKLLELSTNTSENEETAESVWPQPVVDCMQAFAWPDERLASVSSRPQTESVSKKEPFEETDLDSLLSSLDELQAERNKKARSAEEREAKRLVKQLDLILDRKRSPQRKQAPIVSDVIDNSLSRDKK